MPASAEGRNPWRARARPTFRRGRFAATVFVEACLAALPAVDGRGSHAHQFGQTGLGQAEAGAEVFDAAGVIGWYEESHLARNVPNTNQISSPQQWVDE